MYVLRCTCIDVHTKSNILRGMRGNNIRFINDENILVFRGENCPKMSRKSESDFTYERGALKIKLPSRYTKKASFKQKGAICHYLM